jgi:hypothetical protein
MDIIYTDFNKWNQTARNVNDRFNPIKVTGLSEESWSAFTIKVTVEKARAIDDVRHELADLLPVMQLFTDVVSEIDFNIANISSLDQTTRYLKYLKNELHRTKLFLSSTLAYEWILDNTDDLPFDLDGDTLATTPYISKQDEAIEQYLSQCIRTINAYTEIEDHVDTLLNPDQPLILGAELTANTHKLILLHRLGVFEPIYEQYYQQLGAVRFAKLIATILGIDPEKHEGFRPSVNEMIKEIIKPNGRKSLQNDKAARAVDVFLAEIGIINKAL